MAAADKPAQNLHFVFLEAQLLVFGFLMPQEAGQHLADAEIVPSGDEAHGLVVEQFSGDVVQAVHSFIYGAKLVQPVAMSRTHNTEIHTHFPDILKI